MPIESEIEMTVGLPSLRIQTVLFNNEPDAAQRAFEAVLNSLRQAEHLLSRWVISFGDSSPEPVVGDDWVRERVAAAKRYSGEFFYTFFGENLGHGGGHNALHRDSTEDLLLILNPDGVVAPDLIFQLLNSMTPETGVMDARQLPLEHPKDYEPETGIASWSSLACALTHSHVFRELGGLDHETFFMYCDDVDYSWRVRLSGRLARYCPRARMFHDKRIDNQGVMEASASEHYYSAEASLMLAYKYSRDDVLKRLEDEMGLEPEGSYAAQALAEFMTRRSEGRLPVRLDPDHRVAEFTGRTYGAHRF